jgi:hypothetical protein
MLISLVVLIISFGCGFFLWQIHLDELNRDIGGYKYQDEDTLNSLMGYTQELEKLLLMVTPKIFEQVLAARELTEQETSILLNRFSAMLDGLQQIIDFANRASQGQLFNSVEDIKNNAEKIRLEIDVVLESLQFQDRVSQILTQVENNLAKLKNTVENTQLQDGRRNVNIIKVEEFLSNIQKNYESVNQPSKRSMAGNSIDELTFF